MQALIEHTDEEAVAWLPDGKSFVIVNPDVFCNDVLNKIFKEAKYASFVRKLHRWGFVRLTSGTGTDCFHHPMFERNKREAGGKISCTPRDTKDKEWPWDRLVEPPSLAGEEKFTRAKVTQVVGATRHEDENERNRDAAAKPSREEGSNDTRHGDKEKEQEPLQSSPGNDNDNDNELGGGTGVTADPVGSVNI